MSCEQIAYETHIARNSAEANVAVPKPEGKIFSSAVMLKYFNSNIGSQLEDLEDVRDYPDSARAERTIPAIDSFDEEQLGLSPPASPASNHKSADDTEDVVVPEKRGFCRSNMLTFVLFFLGCGICVTLNWVFYVRTVNDIKAALGVDPQELAADKPDAESTGAENEVTEEDAVDANAMVLEFLQKGMHNSASKKQEGASFLQMNRSMGGLFEDNFAGNFADPDRNDMRNPIGGGSGSGAGAKRWRKAEKKITKERKEKLEQWQFMIKDAVVEKLTMDENWNEVLPELEAQEKKFAELRENLRKNKKLDARAEKDLKQQQVAEAMEVMKNKRKFQIPSWMLATFAPAQLEKRENQILLKALMDVEVQHLVDMDSSSKSPFTQAELSNRIVESTKALADLKNTIKDLARLSLKTENLKTESFLEGKKSVSNPYLSLLQTIDVDPRGGVAWFNEHGQVEGNYKSKTMFDSRKPTLEYSLTERGNLRNELRNLSLLDAHVASLKGWQVEVSRSWRHSYARRVVGDTHAGVVSWLSGKAMDVIAKVALVALFA